MVELNVGEEFEIAIQRLGIYGEGVGKLQGFTVFVEGALPGECALVKIYEKRKTYARAHLLDLLSTSPHRVTPICPLFGECGGCQFLHLEYSQQLEVKRQRVVDALERIGGFSAALVAPCAASPLQLGYRNKIQLPCSKDKPMQLGLYARKTHNLVQVEKCYIHCDQGEEVFAIIQNLLKTLPGLESLKHVLIKTSVKTGEVLVILVTAERAPPFLGLFAQRIFNEIPKVRGVVQNINPASGNVILSEEYHTLAGEPFIEEELLGYTVKISPASFFQVNTHQAEQLYQKAIELCALTGEETVLDAYCGVGVLSLIMAKSAKQVIGIECVEDAVHNARENAARNAVSNIRFICAPIEQTITSFKDIDVALLNPPRKGCDSHFLQTLLHAAPKRIIYISCDPATLARDLKFLCTYSYTLDSAYPFDMFPQTAHVECIARLTLK